MKGDEQGLVAVVEDVLGAVAVMVVDVENGDPAPAAEVGSGHGRVVQEAISAVGGAAGVVTRRPAQGIGRRRAGE